MEEAQDWYLQEDLTNLLLLEDSELIYEPLFFDVVSEVTEPPSIHYEGEASVKEFEVSSSDANPKEQYKCHHCFKSFQFKSRLERHLTCHQRKQYHCNECDKDFSRRDVLETHMKKAHGLLAADKERGGAKAKKMMRPCPHCPAQLSSSFHYDRHIRAHQKNLGSGTGFQCSHCAKIFQTRRKYLLHLKNHVGEKKYQCDTCGQKFLQEEWLKRHQRVHSREKPFVCQFCHQCFSQQIHLRRHCWRKHSQSKVKKAFACSTCDKVFLTASELKNHELYHSSHRAFSCQFCSMSFVEKAHLDRHSRRIHQGLRRFPCSLGCGKAFYEKYELNYHLKSVCPRRE